MSKEVEIWKDVGHFLLICWRLVCRRTESPLHECQANRQHVATRLQVKCLKILFFGSFDQRQYLVLSRMLFSPHNYVRWRNCNEFLQPHTEAPSPFPFISPGRTHCFLRLPWLESSGGEAWVSPMDPGSEWEQFPTLVRWRALACAGVCSFHHACMLGPRAPFGWLVCEPKIFWAVLTFCESFPHFLWF